MLVMTWTFEDGGQFGLWDTWADNRLTSASEEEKFDRQI